MAGTIYRIKLVKPDFQLEAEGDKAFVMGMIKRFEGGAPAIEVTPKNSLARSKTQKGKTVVERKPLSVGEFILQVGVKKHTELVLAFGYYLEKHAGAANFTAADINSCYYDAKMERSNTSQMLVRNIRSRRIMEAKKKSGEKGRRSYVLTRTGEEFIARKLIKEQE